MSVALVVLYLNEHTSLYTLIYFEIMKTIYKVKENVQIIIIFLVANLLYIINMNNDTNVFLKTFINGCVKRSDEITQCVSHQLVDSPHVVGDVILLYND